MLRTIFLLILGLHFQSATASASTLATCSELTGGPLRISIDSAIGAPLIANFSDGRSVGLAYDSAKHSWTARVGRWPDADYMTLEIASLDGRLIAVRHAQENGGDGPVSEAIFRCDDFGLGAASSNGG